MPKKTKEINIFTFLNQINYKKGSVKYDKKVASAYLLSLWLSHDKNIIDIVNEINHLQFDLPDDIIYNYYHSKIPKGKRFIRWTKKTKQDKKKKKIIDELKEKFTLSTREAEIIYNTVGE